MALIVFLLIAFQDDSCDKIGNVELPECVIDNWLPTLLIKCTDTKDFKSSGPQTKLSKHFPLKVPHQPLDLRDFIVN